MKKIILLIIIVFLCGCEMKQIDLEQWPSKYPKYEYKGNIYIKSDNSSIEIRDINKGDVNTYLTKVKEEYSSSLVNNKEIYQGVNQNGKMIKVEYIKEKNILKISEN